MATISLKEARRCIAAVEKALREGYAPPQGRGTRDHGAISIAAKRLGVNRMTLYHRVDKGGPIELLHGISVDWSLWKRPAGDKVSNEQAADPIEVRRLNDQVARERAARVSAERAAVGTAGLRKALFGLTETPLSPPDFRPQPDPTGSTREAVILFLSDIHMGEAIDLEQMGGRNCYNQNIAQARLERYFDSVVKLGTKHWSGPAPAVIYLVLGGDLVSGEIHEELAKTNDLLAIPAVRRLSECLVAGIRRLRDGFPGIEIRVLSIPGNHGRTTRKPEAKGFALDSYDTLVAWSVERWFSARNEKGITFSAPASGDALVNIHGWQFLFTHGDRIGSRGGAGFIGPAATAARGMQRVIQDYAAEGSIVDYVVIGHFHTPLELEQGFVNGTLAGPSEYSRSGRMRSHPAGQWMLTVHPERGVARRWKILVGSPDEGSIYRGRVSC